MRKNGIVNKYEYVKEKITMDNKEKALLCHKEWNGKLETVAKSKVKTREDLAIGHDQLLDGDDHYRPDRGAGTGARHVRPDARLAREPGGDRLRKADPRLRGRPCARDHFLFLHNRVLQGAVCGVCGGAVRDHAAVLAFGEQHRAYGVLVRLHAAAGFLGVLHRGRAVHPTLGIHDAREQHADVLTGSEPA